MNSSTAAAVLSALCAFGVAASASGPAPVYAPENFSAEYRASLMKEMAPYIDCAQQSLAALRAEFAQCPAAEIPKERFAKRMEIAESLLKMMQRDALSADADAPLFLERQRNDMEEFIKYFRQEIDMARRLAAMEETVYDATEFGAVGDGETNNAGAFRSLIGQLASAPGRVLVKIPAGVYFIDPGEDGPHLLVSGMKDMVFDGGGEATLLFARSAEKCMGIQISDSDNVVFRGLTLEYRGKLYAQGTVVAVEPENDAVVLKMEPDSPLPKLNAVTMAFEASGRIVNDASNKFFSRVEELGDGLCRAFIGHAFGARTGGLKPGMIVVIPDRRNIGCAFGISGGKFCGAEGITVLNSNGLAFSTSNSVSPSFVNCTVRPREGAYVSSNADALFNWRPVHIGIFAKNCSFHNMNDDCFNTLAPGVAIAEVRDGKLIPDNTNRDAGTNLLIVSAYTGEIKMQSAVSANGTTKFGETFTGELTMKHTVPANVDTFASRRQRAFTEEERQAHFLGKKKLENEPDMFFEPNHCGLGTVLINYRAGNNRNNGITVQASNVLIENCEIENSGCGINLGALLNWKEGPAPYNVTVRNAKFTDNVFGMQCQYLTTDGQTSPVRALRGITVENAVITGSSAAGMRLLNVDGGVFRNISFVNVRRNLEIDNSGNLEFENCR